MHGRVSARDDTPQIGRKPGVWRAPNTGARLRRRCVVVCAVCRELVSGEFACSSGKMLEIFLILAPFGDRAIRNATATVGCRPNSLRYGTGNFSGRAGNNSARSGKSTHSISDPANGGHEDSRWLTKANVGAPRGNPPHSDSAPALSQKVSTSVSPLRLMGGGCGWPSFTLHRCAPAYINAVVGRALGFMAEVLSREQEKFSLVQ